MPVYRRPGRLHRTLGAAAPGPFFSVTSPALGTLTDDHVTDVVIHRGKAERGGGMNPTTAEITVKAGPVLDAISTNLRVYMNAAPAAALGARLGRTGAAIAQRYYGRLGQITVNDTGTGTTTTTYGAGSYANRLTRSPKLRTPTAGQSLRTVIGDLLTVNDPSPISGIRAQFFGVFDTLAETSAPVTFKDAIGRYAGDLGILIRETREGILQVRTLPYRIETAAAQLAAALPLTRSQAISPATWEQRNEWPAANVEYLYIREDGKKILGLVTADNPYPIEAEETLSYDWSYIKANSEQLYRNAWGIRKATNPQYFSVPSITVDLLYLIGSDKQYHRDQAGQLLALEPGDPVYFSPDWPAVLRGVHMAEGITETINAEQWTLELSLVPYEHALGANSPAVPGRTWDSAGGTWNNDTRTWNEA